MKKLIFITVSSMLLSYCSQTSSKVDLPYKTSYGNLVTIEKKDTVKTIRNSTTGLFKIPDMKTYTSSKEVDLFLLSFEGINRITGINKGERNKETVSFDFEFGLPLISKDKKEIMPVFIGYFNETGSLTDDNSELELMMPKSDGDNYTPIRIFPGSKLSHLYQVPKGSSTLYLKDGKEQIQVH